MSAYRSDEYSDFEASALAQLSCKVYDDDDDEPEYALTPVPMEECDPEFEELYCSTTPTDDDALSPDKINKRRINFRRSYRNDDSSLSSTSTYSRRRSQSGQNLGFLVAPKRGVHRTQSHNITSSRGIAFSSPKANSHDTLRGSARLGTPLRSKSSDALQSMVISPAASLGKSISRRILRIKSSSTKATCPEEHSLYEEQRSGEHQDSDESDSTVYFDDMQSSRGQGDDTSESSMDLYGNRGPPVFWIEAELQRAHDSLNSSALMYGSMPTLRVEENIKIEI